MKIKAQIKESVQAYIAAIRTQEDQLLEDLEKLFQDDLNPVKVHVYLTRVALYPNLNKLLLYRIKINKRNKMPDAASTNVLAGGKQLHSNANAELPTGHRVLYSCWKDIKGGRCSDGDGQLQVHGQAIDDKNKQREAAPSNQESLQIKGK